MVKTTAITGNAKARKVIMPAPAVSPEATTEFPKPPVVAVETTLPPANTARIVAAVPPPAISAKAQSGKASSPANWLAKRIAPATVANGIEMPSNKWSTKGM